MIIEGFWFALLNGKDGPVVYFSNTNNAWPNVWRLLNYNIIVAFADALMVRRKTFLNQQPSESLNLNSVRSIASG